MSKHIIGELLNMIFSSDFWSIFHGYACGHHVNFMVCVSLKLHFQQKCMFSSLFWTVLVLPRKVCSWLILILMFAQAGLKNFMQSSSYCFWRISCNLQSIVSVNAWSEIFFLWRVQAISCSFKNSYTPNSLFKFYCNTWMNFILSEIWKSSISISVQYYYIIILISWLVCVIYIRLVLRTSRI